MYFLRFSKKHRFFPLHSINRMGLVTGACFVLCDAGSGFLNTVFTWISCLKTGRDSSVGIATRYGLGGQGIESRWGRDFPHSFRPALGPTQPPVQWVPGLPGGKADGAWRWPPTPISAPRSWKGRAIPVLTLWVSVACYRENLYLLPRPLASSKLRLRACRQFPTILHSLCSQEIAGRGHFSCLNIHIHALNNFVIPLCLMFFFFCVLHKLVCYGEINL